MDIQVIRDKYQYRYISCPHCDSELKIRKDTVKYHYDNGYNVANVKCPCCFKEFKILR